MRSENPSLRPETAHMIQILRSAIRVLGYTNREIETKLGVSGGYLTRVFNGTMELRFEHIVDIARAIGMEPEEVFQLAYPQPRNPPTESAQRLRETFGPRQPTVPAPSEPVAPSKPKAGTPVPGDLSFSDLLEQEVERTMRKVFQKLFAEVGMKGIAAGE